MLARKRKIKPQRLQDVIPDTDPSCLTQVKASAGAGKTFDLTERFLRLLAKSDCTASRVHAACFSDTRSDLGDILAVTFTNAAALEMRNRVIRRLKCTALSVTDQNQREACSAMLPETAHDRVDRIVRDPSALNIRTIDSLVHLIVRAAALDLGLPPDFTSVFSSEEALAPYLDALIEQAAHGDTAMRGLLRSACGAVAAQSATSGFLVGKKLLGRLRALFDAALRGDYDSLSPPEVIETRRRALHKDLTEAAQNLLAIAGEHSLPWNKAALAAVQKVADGATDCTSKYLEKAAAVGLFRKNSALPMPVTTSFTALAEAADAWKQRGPLFRETLKLTPFIELARTLARAFMHNLENEGNLPSLLVPRLAQKVLHGENGVPDALCRMGSRLRHFLLDEFQDTSREQWLTLRPLVEEALSRGGSLTCVGDVKQSIYSWRGGESELFDSVFEDEGLTRLAPEGARQRTLPFNWRSGRKIMEHNNAFFTPLRVPDTALRVMAALLPGDTPSHILRDSANKVRQAFEDCAQQMPASGKTLGGYVSVERLSSGTSGELNEEVLERLCGLLRDITRRRKPGDVMVLARSNNQAAAVAERLVREGLPVVTENSLLLATHPLIAQTVALLTFLDSPDDDIAFWTALTGSIMLEHPEVRNHPEAGGRETLTRESLYNRLPAGPGPLHKNFRAWRPDVWKTFFAPFHIQSGLMTPYDTVQEWFARLNVEARFPEARTFLRRFMEVLHRAEENDIGDTSSFLAYWREKGGEEKVPMPENMDAVRVMTIHKSKGLEAPVVIVPWTNFTARSEDTPVVLDAGDGLRLAVPTRKSLGEPYYTSCARQARENLHMLYVALTRAKEELHIFRASALSRENIPSLCNGMDILWEIAGLTPPYFCGTQAEKTPASDGPGPSPLPPQDDFAWQESDPRKFDRRDFSGDWLPMDWLPRLKIFRTTPEHFANETGKSGASRKPTQDMP